MEIDSSGTGDYHIGEPPDLRAQEYTQKKGLDISGLRARQFIPADFSEYDRIFVMDRSNYDNVVVQTQDPAERDKVEMILEKIQPGEKLEVPDPYFGGEEGFRHVYDLLEKACDKILDEIEHEQKG